MRGHFEKDVAIYKPVENIYSLISHPQQIVGLQPLITAVEIKKEAVNSQGQKTYDFVSIEDIKILGFIPMQNRIETHMILENPPYRLQQTGKTRAGITLYQTLSLEEHTNHVSVTNAIDYDAPWFIFPYVRYELTNAHTAWLDILKNRAENS